MADISDVGASLAARVASTLYPTGGVGNSIAGVVVRIVHGWPNKQELDAFVKAGKAQVSVVSDGVNRNTTRYTQQEWSGTINPKTYGLSVAGQAVTVTGAAPAPYYVQNFALVVDGVAYKYQAHDGDTPAMIAQALAALIPGAGNVGAVINLAVGARLAAAREGSSAANYRNVRNQIQQFCIAVWAPTPDARDAIAKPVDLDLADLTFLDLVDGSQGRLRFVSSLVIDHEAEQGIFRRDLRYTVDYATVATDDAYEVITTETHVRNEHAEIAVVIG